MSVTKTRQKGISQHNEGRNTDFKTLTKVERSRVSFVQRDSRIPPRPVPGSPQTARARLFSYPCPSHRKTSVYPGDSSASKLPSEILANICRQAVVKVYRLYGCLRGLHYAASRINRQLLASHLAVSALLPPPWTRAIKD